MVGSTATSESTRVRRSGTGLSGYGREMGFEAIREYRSRSRSWVNVDAQSRRSNPRPEKEERDGNRTADGDTDRKLSAQVPQGV